MPNPEFREGKAVDLVAREGRQYIAVEIVTGISDGPVNVSKSPETDFDRIKMSPATEDAEVRIGRVLGES